MTRELTPEESRQAVLRAISEAAWQARVRETGTLFSWQAHVVWDPRHAPEGWPDLFLVKYFRREGETWAVAAELKDEKRHLTAAQDAWLTLLAGLPHVLTAVWRPRHEDTVEAVLGAATPGVLARCWGLRLGG